MIEKRIGCILQIKLFAIALMISIGINSSAQKQFTHTVTKANITCNYDCTLLDVPDLNNNPAAIIMVTPLLEKGLNLNPHPIGVYYFKKQWNIFNLDQRPIPAGSTFHVEYVTNPDVNHFQYFITKENIQKDGSAFIDASVLNNHSDIQFSCFVSWMPEVSQGIPNRDEVNIQFNPKAGKWYISNLNKKSLFPGIVYNVIISNEGNTVAGPVKGDPVIKKDPKTIIKPTDAIPVITGPIDKKNIIPKKSIAPSYDFSNVHICIDEISNKSLPPKTPVTPEPAIPKIKPNGELEPITTIIQPLSVATNLMWSPGENLTVGFLSGETITVINKVKKYIKEWETYANIRFVFINDVSQAQIKVGFKKDGTSWSWMGRDALVNSDEGRTMNLGWLNDRTAESEFRRVVLHEFGHVLGFIHEHQSPAGGIPWDTAKVYSYFGGSPNYWNRAKVDLQVLNKYSVTSTNSSMYDKFSIMHYSYPAYLTTDSSTFPENTNLSVTDKAFVSKIYPYPPGPPVSKGVLKTGDDCDEIEFTVEYNVVNISEVVFILEPGRDPNNNIITWWKKIAIPLKGGGEIGMEIQDGYSANQKVQRLMIDEARGIAFGKAKILGVHTGLGYTWKVWPAIRGGCRVTFVWRRDRC